MVLQRLAQVMATEPSRVLQELVEAARDLCGADSAGISLETVDEKGASAFHWAALSGRDSPLLNALLPLTFLPCTICIQEQRPQLVQVPAANLKKLGVRAARVSSGMLIPWTSDGQRGTLWVLAHGRKQAFTQADYKLMRTFADFAATAYRNLRLHQRSLQSASAAASASTAHILAHNINNPLQSITNSLFLAAHGGPNAATYAEQALSDLTRLSQLVRDLLSAYRNPVVH